jgi:hypothetical protein
MMSQRFSNLQLAGAAAVAAAVALALGAQACSDDDVPKWVQKTCDKYEECGMLEKLAIFGSDAEACGEALSKLVSSGQADDPDPTTCGKDEAACEQAFDAQSCDDFEARKPLPECLCPPKTDASLPDGGKTPDSGKTLDTGKTPETATPDTATPDTATPDTATPDTVTPDTGQADS